jgi:hypothetical protein
MNCGEECIGEFVISGGYCTELFDFAEEPLDEVAFAVEGEISLTFDEPVGFGRNDGSDVPFFQRLDQGVGVVRLIGEESFRLDLVEQRLGLTEIGCLAWRERQGGGVAQSIDDHVYLGRQPSAGSTDSLADPPFLRAPALC